AWNLRPGFQLVEGDCLGRGVLKPQTPRGSQRYRCWNIADDHLFSPVAVLHVVTTIFEGPCHPAITGAFKMKVGVDRRGTPAVLRECDHRRFTRAQLERQARAG